MEGLRDVSSGAVASARGWMILLVGSLFCLFQIVMQATPAFMVNELMSSLALNRAGIGMLASSLLYVYVLLQLPAGWMMDRYGVRRCLLAGVSCLVAGTVIFSQATGITAAVIGRGLMGAGSATAIVGSMALASAWFPARMFPLIVGFLEMASMLGGAACGLATPGLVEDFGWRQAMGVYAAIGSIILFSIFALVKNRPSEASATQQDQTTNLREPHVSAWQIFTCRPVLLSALFGFGMFGLISVFGMMWGAPFLSSLYVGHEAFAARGVSLMFTGVALGTVACGWLSVKIGSCRQLMIGGSLLAVVLLTAILFVPVSISVMAALLFLLGLSAGCYGLAFVAPEKSLTSSGIATAMAFINASLLVSGQLLQPLMGRILDYRAGAGFAGLADYQVAFIPVLAILVLALLASIAFREAADDADIC